MRNVNASEFILIHLKYINLSKTFSMKQRHQNIWFISVDFPLQTILVVF